MTAPVREGFARPSIGEDEIADVVEGSCAPGPMVARFEQEFAQLVGVASKLNAASRAIVVLHDGGLPLPLHLNPYFQKGWGYRIGDFPVAEKAFDDPDARGMTMEEADSVISGVRAVLRGT